MTKKQAKIERKKKKIKKILKLIILIALIAGGICFALISPIFNIEKIEVTGNNKIPSETIISLSQLENGQNIFKFNKNKTVEEIKTNAYIENAKISRNVLSKLSKNETISMEKLIDICIYLDCTFDDIVEIVKD